MRGLQEVTISQPIIGNIFAFNYLLAYFALVALVGLIFIALQRRQAARHPGHESANWKRRTSFLPRCR